MNGVFSQRVKVCTQQLEVLSQDVDINSLNATTLAAGNGRIFFEKREKTGVINNSNEA